MTLGKTSLASGAVTVSDGALVVCEIHVVAHGGGVLCTVGHLVGGLLHLRERTGLREGRLALTRMRDAVAVRHSLGLGEVGVGTSLSLDGVGARNKKEGVASGWQESSTVADGTEMKGSCGDAASVLEANEMQGGGGGGKESSSPLCGWTRE